LVDPERAIGYLADMVRIPSVNPFGEPPGDGRGEAELAVYFADALSTNGWQVESTDAAPARPNVWATRAGPGKGLSLGLVGHLDTVGVVGYEAPFTAEMSGGRLHGRGASDMKAGLAAFLEVAAVVTAIGADLNGDLIIAAVIDEEHAMLGSRRFGTSGPHLDCAIVGEPTDLAVCPAHLGQFAVQVETLGRAVHTSAPLAGVNAVEKMADVIGALIGYREELHARPGHPLCGGGTVTATVIRGGDVASLVPDRCTLEVDRRIVPGETGADVLAELRNHLARVADIDPDFVYELGPPTWDLAPLDTPVAEPVVQALLASAAEMGLRATPVAFPAATDAPNLGVPAVVCGPGSITQAHTLDEYVEVEQVAAAVHLYLRAIDRLIGY
jgi:acetylornithine deacetylase